MVPVTTKQLFHFSKNHAHPKGKEQASPNLWGKRRHVGSTTKHQIKRKQRINYAPPNFQKAHKQILRASKIDCDCSYFLSRIIIILANDDQFILLFVSLIVTPKQIDMQIRK